MRLICPQCNALYDVPAGMIPPEGREVECSACGHVWQQHSDMRAMRGLSGDLRAPRAPSAAEAGARDLGAAPDLQRPLPDDVLSILREETARELSARRAARGEAPSPEPSPETLVLQDADEAGPTDLAVTGPAQDEPSQPAAAKPAQGLPVTEPRPAREDATEWPATTVTEPDDSQPRVLPRRSSPARKAKSDARPMPKLAKPPERNLADDSVAQADDAKATGAAGVSSGVAPSIELAPVIFPPVPRRRVAKGLPDAAELAATLQVEPSAAAADMSAPQGHRQSGYRAGFLRALAVSALLLLVYAAASGWVSGGNAPGPVVAVVGGIDAARAGLQNAASALVGNGAN
ncbi:hypothetical protein FQV27_06300 [Paracoccus aurantiacus]|uniref:Zinc finger/thioredoxin putative domain-containing protein n=1 Tax=Paracoccus aurantiacus TaxID=2599412 RepID=A0A5C6S5M3_9RHOB|nr:zinc-ribbon domain-containing protein [Paracoccus aurantiacus]TXB69729.1 hypothetical protein FQV27_06300 [Paracoccus aurantiacus]